VNSYPSDTVSFSIQYVRGIVKGNLSFLSVVKLLVG